MARIVMVIAMVLMLISLARVAAITTSQRVLINAMHERLDAADALIIARGHLIEALEHRAEAAENLAAERERTLNVYRRMTPEIPAKKVWERDI